MNLNRIVQTVCENVLFPGHATRMLHENRKEARRLLTAKLDNLWNGDDSVEAQERRLFEKKHTETNRRRRKSDEMKKRWKERENLDES